ncbi:uncharacterized protein ACOB8E_017800 [Sarcophilus harrisii]
MPENAVLVRTRIFLARTRNQGTPKTRPKVHVLGATTREALAPPPSSPGEKAPRKAAGEGAGLGEFAARRAALVQESPRPRDCQASECVRPLASRFSRSPGNDVNGDNGDNSGSGSRGAGGDSSSSAVLAAALVVTGMSVMEISPLIMENVMINKVDDPDETVTIYTKDEKKQTKGGREKTIMQEDIHDKQTWDNNNGNIPINMEKDGIYHVHKPNENDEESKFGVNKKEGAGDNYRCDYNDGNMQITMKNSEITHNNDSVSQTSPTSVIIVFC